MVTVKPGLSLEQFLKLPDEKPALEYEEGVVSQKVSPKGHHSTLQLTLASVINAWAKPEKRAYAFPELRATFAGRSYVPDVSVYRWERIPRDSSGRVAQDFLLPPDVAIEIISPGQGVTGLVRRCLWYVGNGVTAALLVDPEDESILLFRASQSPLALSGEDRLDLPDVLPGFALSAGELFAALTLG